MILMRIGPDVFVASEVAALVQQEKSVVVFMRNGLQVTNEFPHENVAKNVIESASKMLEVLPERSHS